MEATDLYVKELERTNKTTGVKCIHRVGVADYSDYIFKLPDVCLVAHLTIQSDKFTTTMVGFYLNGDLILECQAVDVTNQLPIVCDEIKVIGSMIPPSGVCQMWAFVHTFNK